MTAIGDIFPCNVTDIAVVREAARAAMVAGQWNDAAAAWERLRALEPNGVDAFVLGAEAAKCLGRLEEAEALALDASRRFPDVLWALHN